MYTRVSQEETSLLFPCSSTTNNSFRGNASFPFRSDDGREKRKRERERKRERSDKVSKEIVENGATGFVKY